MRDTVWSLRLDLASARLLIWFASSGRDDVDLLPQTHLYFYDRYSRLAKVYSHRGDETKARTLRARAIDHYRRSGEDGGPPYAAAKGMRRPRPYVITNASADRD